MHVYVHKGQLHIRTNKMIIMENATKTLLVFNKVLNHVQIQIISWII